MRKPIIAGNWKLNKTIYETAQLAAEIALKANTAEVEVVIAPTAVCLSDAKYAIEESHVKLAAQNMYSESSGAFTGEISPDVLNELGVEYVIIGHSERRKIFMETDSMINKKVIVALSKNIKPILCVGETLKQREQDLAEAIVLGQVSAGLMEVDQQYADKIVIAYEPVWAIGTGKTATKEDANQMCTMIRKELARRYDEDFASRVRILYGGSVKASNIKELMEMSNIDGALVGGASLNSDEFAKIVNYK